MKKVLTVLLTLVMAICLINLNNSHTKAENADHTIHYDNTAVSPSPKWYGIPASDIAEKKTVEIQNDGSSGNIYVHLIDGTTDTIGPISSKTYTIKYGVSIANLNQQDDGNINLFDGITTTGLKYNGDTTEGKTGWLEWNPDATPSPDYKGIDNTRLNALGISMNGNTATFNKSLTSTTNIIDIESPLSIELDENISINSPTGIPVMLYVDATITIDGKGHELKLVTQSKNSFYAIKDVVLKDINIVCENSNTYVYSDTVVIEDGNIYLKGNVTLDILNKGTVSNIGALAFQASGKDIEFVEGATMETKKGGADKTSTDDVFKYTVGTPGDFPYGQYVTDVTPTLAKYVRIEQQVPSPEPSPTPSPSEPSKKDESCEKVIGPTWHWNNDKGICEDVGVVGTATR